VSASDWLSSRVGEARAAAVEAAASATDSAADSAIAALLSAFRKVESKRLPFSVTLGVSLGPVSLSVTVEAYEVGMPTTLGVLDFNASSEPS
jgi:fatty acid-binding protein DegV